MNQILDKTRLIDAHRPSWAPTVMWLACVAVYALLQWLLVSAILAHSWLTVGVLVLLLAHLMHVHTLAIHEAAHGTLCPVRFLNDAFGIFIGIHAFMSLSVYRAVHHNHHAWLATPRDDELWPFVIPGMPRWWRVFAACLELTLGLFFTPLLYLRGYLRIAAEQKPEVRRRARAEIALIVLVWIAVLALFGWFGGWRFLLLNYLVPAMMAGNLQSLRKYIEHMGLTGSTVLGSTRSVVPRTLLGRLAARTMFNIHYHGVHHKYGQMPSSVAPEFSDILMPKQADERAPFPSYWAAFRDMVGTLADPRVGAQWNSTDISDRISTGSR
ncbi:MAG: hypothetical protein KatS3mg105_0378 [Gemmatales bacterium]|nr:MAG: hypothetical protein KatS3mg105_0378 [Gemmatales bacterium]